MIVIFGYLCGAVITFLIGLFLMTIDKPSFNRDKVLRFTNESIRDWGSIEIILSCTMIGAFWFITLPFVIIGSILIFITINLPDRVFTINLGDFE